VLRKKDKSRMETPQMRFLIPRIEVLLRDNCESEKIRGNRNKRYCGRCTIHSRRPGM
jgi:hypothetical protein